MRVGAGWLGGVNGLEPDEKSKRTCAVTAGMSHRGDHGLHDEFSRLHGQ
jgi:hypothetical protein